MNIHRSQIFMGNGDRSMAECYGLVRDLQEALSHISALQQAPRSDLTVEQSDDLEHMEYHVEDVAQNIYTALTGRRFNRKGDDRTTDLSQNRVPYGFLTDEEKAVLKDHEDAGGGIICYVFSRDGGFWTVATYSRHNHEIYRTVPLPRDEDHKPTQKVPQYRSKW